MALEVGTQFGACVILAELHNFVRDPCLKKLDLLFVLCLRLQLSSMKQDKCEVLDSEILSKDGLLGNLTVGEVATDGVDVYFIGLI